MPSLNPMTILCCCGFQSRRGDDLASATRAVALQPIPLSDQPPEEEPQEPKKKPQHSLVGLSDIDWAVPVHDSSPGSGSIIHQPTEDADSDSNQDQLQVTKKSSTVFDTMRNKIIRSMALNNENDQPSLLSVGNSEEDIARRAELRRIMHQRIRTELESDEPDEHVENKPPDSSRCISSVVELALPNSGPRDAIEFGVDSAVSRGLQSARLGTDQDSEPPKVTTVKSERCYSGMPEVFSEDDASREGMGVSRSAVTHLSLNEDVDFAHSKKSFQLSNSAGRLDRILGPDSSFNSYHASSGDDQSALGVWLIAQGLRSRDNSTLFFDEGEEIGVPKETEPTEQKLSVSNKEDMNPTSDSYEVSEKEAQPTTLNTSDKIESQPRSRSNTTNDYNDTHVSSGELAWGPAVTTLLNSFTDNTHSSDPSKSQSSPGRSQQNVYRLDPKDLESMELSPFRWPSQASFQDQADAGEQSLEQFTSMFQSRPHSVGNVHTIQSLAQVAYDPVPLAQSGSASIVQCEAEIEKTSRRFSDVLASDKPEKKVITRFREELPRSTNQPVFHRSFRNRMHLTVPSHFGTKSEGYGYRQSEGKPKLSQPQDCLFITQERTEHRGRRVGDRSNRLSNLSIRPHMNRPPSEEYRKPSLERQESATNLWQRAIRLEAEGRRSSSFQLSTPNADQRNPSSSRSLNGTDPIQNGTSSVSDLRREVSQLTPTTDEISSPSNSKWLIERWVSQMRPKTTQAADTLRSVLSDPLIGPPKSWSKFPSHNREERNKNVTSRDRVSPLDFAVKHVSSEGQILWATDILPGEENARTRTLTRSFTINFGEFFKSKVSLIRPLKGLRHRRSQASVARHANISPAHMEYPEMGIRPSEPGYTELQALGREINNMKGKTHQDTSKSELPKQQSSRSLGDRVVALMHEAMGQRQAKNDETPRPTERAIRPPTPSLMWDSITATDVFITPKSHFSDDAMNGREKSSVEVDHPEAEENGA
ncbi:hypothetical protein FHETE_2182 [Fusarium heterosporum]|uniref:Uncharacterized protein n=1 Tax=Fusarium heterosporum TaxID=42747 RepID=A0A8H5TVA4_FUSHE|nr:hypothetical protein FHETE_2182 [Fusarium heterosporum]